MPHVITHKISRGNAAHAREEIRALEDVGRTPGGIQYRTQTGAQAELTLPTATDFLLGHDGTRPTWVSATQVATATQPVDSFLHTVTASASQIIISWASVATQFRKFEIELFNMRTATPAKIAARFSTDGIVIDSATNRTLWTALELFNSVITPYGPTATNSASQAFITATTFGIANNHKMNGKIDIWPSSNGNMLPPNIEWSTTFFSTDAGFHVLVRVMGSAHYWPSVDINGLALFPVFGAASFSDGEARLYGRV